MRFIPVTAVLCLLLKSPSVSTCILKGRQFSPSFKFLWAFMNKLIWGRGSDKMLWIALITFFFLNRKRVKTAISTETQEFGVGFPKHVWIVRSHLQASLLSIESGYKKPIKQFHTLLLEEQALILKKREFIIFRFFLWVVGHLKAKLLHSCFYKRFKAVQLVSVGIQTNKRKPCLLEEHLPTLLHRKTKKGVIAPIRQLNWQEISNDMFSTLTCSQRTWQRLSQRLLPGVKQPVSVQALVSACFLLLFPSSPKRQIFFQKKGMQKRGWYIISP